jgi:hypothetical protein
MSRVPKDYAAVTTTPLDVEVVAGSREVNLEVSPTRH